MVKCLFHVYVSPCFGALLNTAARFAPNVALAILSTAMGRLKEITAPARETYERGDVFLV